MIFRELRTPKKRAPPNKNVRKTVWGFQVKFQHFYDKDTTLVKKSKGRTIIFLERGMEFFFLQTFLNLCTSANIFFLKSKLIFYTYHVCKKFILSF